jgi:hypothetical protein
MHDWTPWHPLAVIEGVQWRRRICPGCATTQDEPTPAGPVPDSAISAAADALIGEESGYCGPGYGTCGSLHVSREHAADLARVALAAAVPHIERAIRHQIADELRVQAEHEAPNAAEALRFAGKQIAAGKPQLWGYAAAHIGEGDVGELQRELDDLERSDPDVAAAAKSYDAMRDKIIADRRVARGGEATE